MEQPMVAKKFPAAIMGHSCLPITTLIALTGSINAQTMGLLGAFQDHALITVVTYLQLTTQTARIGFSFVKQTIITRAAS